MKSLCVLRICALLGCALTASAQVVAHLEPGSVEIGGFGGITAGLGRTAAGVGGNVAVAATKYILPYGEVTYFPGLVSAANLQRISGTNVNLTSQTDVSFTDFHFGLHLRANNFFKSPNFMPYAVIGGGALRNSATRARVTGTVDGAPFDRELDVSSETNFAVNFGGGLRIYTKNNFGFRIEVKGYKPTGSGLRSDPFMKVTFGVFGYVK